MIWSGDRLSEHTGVVGAEIALAVEERPLAQRLITFKASTIFTRSLI